MNDRRDLEARVLSALNDGSASCDLLLSLFSAAVQSYRRATICQPFPKHFINGTDKLYSEVEQLVRAIPKLSSFTEQPELLSRLPTNVLILLDWVFEFGAKSRISSICIDEFVALSGYSRSCPKIAKTRTVYPSCVFVLNHDTTTPFNTRFESLKAEYGVTLAYHGSPIENWHSILRNGLDNRFGDKDTNLCGSGIYLSEDPTVSMGYSKAGTTWHNSALGDTISCMVCCEVINHPDVRRSEDTRTGIVLNSTKRVPKTYLVVKNNEHVRVKYILVFAASQTTIRGSTKSMRFAVTVLVYLALLLLLGLMRSPYWKRITNPARWL